MKADIVIVTSNRQEAIYIKGNLWEKGKTVSGESIFRLGQLFPAMRYSDIVRIYLSAQEMDQMNWELPEKLSKIPEEFLN